MWEDHDRRRRGVRRLAAEGGLDAADATVLEGLARRYAVPDPERLPDDRELLAELLERAVDAVERMPELTEQERHLWVARYFRLEERLERRAAGDPHGSPRRRQVERPCLVTPLRVAAQRGVARRGPAPDGAGSQPAELAPEPTVMATIMDVSTGGCAVESLCPFEEGGLARIEFELDLRTPVAAVGRTRSTRPLRPAGVIADLQFARISHEHRNRIHRFVYHGGHGRGYGPPVR